MDGHNSVFDGGVEGAPAVVSPTRPSEQATRALEYGSRPRYHGNGIQPGEDCGLERRPSAAG